MRAAAPARDDRSRNTSGPAAARRRCTSMRLAVLRRDRLLGSTSARLIPLRRQFEHPGEDQRGHEADRNDDRARSAGPARRTAAGRSLQPGSSSHAPTTYSPATRKAFRRFQFLDDLHRRTTPLSVTAGAIIADSRAWRDSPRHEYPRWANLVEEQDAVRPPSARRRITVCVPPPASTLPSRSMRRARSAGRPTFRQSSARSADRHEVRAAGRTSNSPRRPRA